MKRLTKRRIDFLVMLMLLSSTGMAVAQGTLAGPTFSSPHLTVTVHSAGGSFGGVTVHSLLSGETIELPQAFAVIFQDGSTASSANMRVAQGLVVEDIAADATSRVAAERSPGKRVCADFTTDKQLGEYRWCLVMRAGGDYFRQELTIRAGQVDLPIAEVRLLDFQDAEAHVSGTVKGSPVVDGGMFFGFEHPLSGSEVTDGHATASIRRVLPLRAGQSVSYSSVIGVAATGQMRRAFLAYIEAERPRPYAPFLHYNSWFDLGYGNDYDEAGAVDRVNAFGEELAVKRHVQLDSYLFDDGWDDPKTLWGFHKGFPQGFTNVAAAAQKYHANIGVWFSPWGGYWKKKEARIAYGRQNNYEIVKDGFALSGKRYYQRFEETCLQMIDRYGVNQFKFDGTGNADSVFPGSEFDSDFDAAIHLIGKLRDHQPKTFINLTTGTYPSPFWLFYADSIWRGGDDDDFAGVGTDRQRWITYRDADTYHNIVVGGPLYPLNSLMLHGLIFAKQAEKLSTDPGNDFPSEVQSYFGSGTQLQEMYITPSLLTKENWDFLAKAANWARDRAPILKDSHWVGGDPGKLAVYGWAAWGADGWVMTLRNPSDKAQDFTLDLSSALELPAGGKTGDTATYPFREAGTPPLKIETGRPMTIHLAPFEVTTFEFNRKN
jgi:hypothetical protein